MSGAKTSQKLYILWLQVGAALSSKRMESISHLLTHSWGTQRSMWNIHLERKSCEPSGHQGFPHWTGHLEPVKQKRMNWKGIKGNEDILQDKAWIPLLEGEAERVHS